MLYNLCDHIGELRYDQTMWCIHCGIFLGSNSSEARNTETLTEDSYGSNAIIGTVTAENLNVRSEPNTSGVIIDQLSEGTRIEILEQSGGWGRINSGWINLKYVELDK